MTQHGPFGHERGSAATLKHQNPQSLFACDAVACTVPEMDYVHAEAVSILRFRIMFAS